MPTHSSEIERRVVNGCQWSHRLLAYHALAASAPAIAPASAIHIAAGRPEPPHVPLDASATAAGGNRTLPLATFPDTDGILAPHRRTKWNKGLLCATLGRVPIATGPPLPKNEYGCTWEATSTGKKHPGPNSGALRAVVTEFEGFRL